MAKTSTAKKEETKSEGSKLLTAVERIVDRPENIIAAVEKLKKKSTLR